MVYGDSLRLEAFLTSTYAAPVKHAPDKAINKSQPFNNNSFEMIIGKSKIIDTPKNPKTIATNK